MARASAAQRAKWNRLLRRVASKAEANTRAALIREFARAATNWDAGVHEARIKAILVKAYNLTANATYPSAKAMLRGKEVRKSVDEAKVSWLIRVSEWVQRIAIDRARKIARESQRIVTDAIAEAAKAGEGQAGGVKRILEKLGGSIARSRARTIARTEINAAQNMAVSEAASVSGIQYEVTWCSAEDERTRAAHVAADGQSRKEGEAFDVGGERLTRPGDTNGKPENTINCRCTLLIEPVLGDDGGVNF
jgi:uncharacterized protein with gpF-like domain